MLFLALLLSSCSNLSIHKRKYRKGYSISSNQYIPMRINGTLSNEKEKETKHLFSFDSIPHERNCNVSRFIDTISVNEITSSKINLNCTAPFGRTGSQTNFTSNKTLACLFHPTVKYNKQISAIKYTVQNKNSKKLSQGIDHGKTALILLCILILLGVILFTGVSYFFIYLFIWGDAPFYYFVLAFALQFLINYLLLVAFYRNKIKIKNRGVKHNRDKTAAQRALSTALWITLPAIILIMLLFLLFSN